MRDVLEKRLALLNIVKMWGKVYKSCLFKKDFSSKFVASYCRYLKIEVELTSMLRL